MSGPRYPSLFQINTRVWLTSLARTLGRSATLDDIPNAELDRLASRGFDWIWLLSVWQTGPQAQAISRGSLAWRQEFEHTLPDLLDQDIEGSGFAITAYHVHEKLGGDVALARLRERMRQRGLKLMLDFVPNHMGLGHPWVDEHPDYFVAGTETELAHSPENYTRVKSAQGDFILAYGRDPYFSGWPDVLQLNYGNPATQEAMIAELLRISQQCDGVRCDMAMLALPEVFERTWGIRTNPFWPHAVERVRQKTPGFCFMAEVYWDLEWTMQQQGFDYAYDKRLYDRLREKEARPVREHFLAGLDYQDKLTRFLENHDEPRAALTFPLPMHIPAAVLTFLSPGLRFFHQGEFEGRLKRISPHLVRAPDEPVDPQISQFYERLLTILRNDVFRNGDWLLLECRSAWRSNWTHDCFICFAWHNGAGERMVVTANYADHQSQCRLQLPFADLAGHAWRFHDELAGATYDRDGNELAAQGLFLDEGAWQTRVFRMTRIG